jgi:hypothetical protein
MKKPILASTLALTATASLALAVAPSASASAIDSPNCAGNSAFASVWSRSPSTWLHGGQFGATCFENKGWANVDIGYAIEVRSGANRVIFFFDNGAQSAVALQPWQRANLDNNHRHVTSVWIH